MKRIITLIAIIGLLNQGFSQAPTWEKEISCIVYSHCTSCHNPKGLAPFSLTNYSDASKYSSSMANAVSKRLMPPSPPDKDYSELAHQNVLSQEEINFMKKWATAGAPSEDLAKAPTPPVYSTKEEITSPDLVGKIPNFTIPNTGADLYQAFVITNPTNANKYITDIEIVPGNTNIVHHVLVFQDTSLVPVENDNNYPGPGYISFGDVGSETSKLIAAWVPGSKAYSTPSGMGILLEKGSRIIVQIHYPEGAEGKIDSTKVNIKYTASPLRNVSIDPILNHDELDNGPLFIPANTTQTFYSQYTVPIDVTALSIAPHAHLICKKFKVFGVTPASDTIKFIKIDNWDFHWQGFYNFKNPIKIPAGTVLYGEAVYDNTINNLNIPNLTPQDVSLGENTTDEMMLIYFGYLPYQNGDENIVLDNASHLAHYENCVTEESSGTAEMKDESDFVAFPNPASTQINFMLSSAENFGVEIVNLLGEVVLISQNSRSLDVSNLNNGIYFIRITADDKKLIQKIVIRR